MSAVISIAFDDLFNIYRFRDKFGVTLSTPNFDRLTDMGVTFDAAYAPVAVCNPSRTAALSGQSQFKTGVHGTTGLQWNDVMGPEDTVVGMFHDAGWTTLGAGKNFHNSSSVALPEFAQLYDEHYQARIGARLENNPVAEPLEPGETLRDDDHVAWAVNRLGAYDGSDDLFMTLGIIRPHAPFIAPQAFFDLYPQDQLVVPFEEGDLDQVSDFYKLFRLQDTYQAFLEREDAVLDLVQGYLASLSYADAKLGAVLDAIAANPALADASIVVWSDHGYELGEKETWHKFTLWEEAANIPFVVVDPALVAGTRVETPVSLLDLTPTLLDLGGVAAPAGADFDGQSVLDFVTAPDPGRVAITSAFGSLSMRVGDYRLIHYSDRSIELYDITKDLDQLQNLALDPSNAALIDSLMARLTAEVQAQGGLFDPAGGDLSGSIRPDTLVVLDGQAAAGAGGDDVYLVGDNVVIFEGRVGGVDTVFFADHDFDIPLNVEIARNHLHTNAIPFVVRGNAQDNIVEIVGAPAEVDGGAGHDTISARSGRDRLDGGDGNDTLVAAAGADLLIGGRGDDSIDAGNDADTVILAADFGLDVIYGGEGGDDRDTLDIIELGEAAVVTMTGAESGMVTHGTSMAMFFGIETVLRVREPEDLETDDGETSDGGGGTDPDPDPDPVEITGMETVSAGDDMVVVLRFADEDRNNLIVGMDTDDSVNGAAGNDTIFGGAGDDRLRGGTGLDSLYGGTGSDVLLGEGGDDLLLDWAGNDSLSGGLGNDRVIDLLGANTLAGGADSDLLIGGLMADTLTGGTGDDVLIGDVFRAFGGSDLLTGQGGNDVLMGGPGGDRFDFRGAGPGGDDVIGAFDTSEILVQASGFSVTPSAADFVPGVDRVLLSDGSFGLDAGTVLAALSDTPDGALLLFTAGGGEARVGSVLFWGVAASSFSIDDFSFS